MDAKKPGWQVSQAVAALVSVSAVPAEQLWQVVWPDIEKVPRLHDSQAVAGLESRSAVPESQVVHDVAVAEAPGTHVEQAVVEFKS